MKSNLVSGAYSAPDICELNCSSVDFLATSPSDGSVSTNPLDNENVEWDI